MAKRLHCISGALGLVGCFLLLGVRSALAQQFVQETTTRFPSPNPSEYSNQLTIGDIDGDGDLDILFANGGNFSSPGADQVVRVYINDGSGFFTDNSNAATGGYAGLHRGVELGDADGDGDLDVVLAQDFNRRPGLLINDGSGHFTSEGATRLPPINLSSSRGQFGDVDNDGDMDLFFTSGSSSRFDCGQYRLYLNDGNGFYTDVTGTMFPTGSYCNNMDCIFGDIDGDFDLDIRTASTGTNNSRLFRNDGTGTFTVVSGVPADNTAYSYDFGDMDGDGDLDLLGANAGSGSSEKLLQNNGAGVFTDVTSRISPNPSIDDNDSKFFDYDNDGDLDFIIGALGGSSERIYTNNGSGFFSLASGVIELQTDSTLDIMVADLTGDGALDVVTAQGESGNFQNRIYVNNGPADTIAPTIVQTEQLADTEDLTGPYVVRAAILDQMTSDRNFFDDGIFLRYTINGGGINTVPMRHSGGQIYRGVIPGQGPNTDVAYWVTATDFAGNTATGPTLMFAVRLCDVDEDCNDGLFCNGAEACVDNTCVSSDPPCAEGESCDELTDSCRQPCNTPSDCADGDLCTQDLCLGGFCEYDLTTCPIGQVCDPLTGCTGPCLSDQACNGGLHCDITDGVCKECLVNEHCDPGSVCDLSDNRCKECVVDGHCDDGLFCNGAERCVDETCTSGVDPCAPGLCRESDDQCVTCLSNADCDDDDPCNGAETCVDGDCQAGAATVDCNENGLEDSCDIGSGTSPDANGDGVPDECTPCASQADCEDGSVCSFDQCIGSVCFTSPTAYADVAGFQGACGPDGKVDIFDIFAELDGFVGTIAEGCEAGNLDIAASGGACQADGEINVFDIFAVLDAFANSPACCGP